MANSRVVAGKQGDQRFVLAEGDARQTPYATIGCASDAQTCARDCSVVWPRIVLKRIEQPRQFGEQALVRVLKGASPMQRLGQKLAFAVEVDASENCLSASLEC